MPSPHPIQNGSLAVSQIIPVLSGSTWQNLKSYLVPGGVICLFVALLFFSIGNTGIYILTLSTFLYSGYFGYFIGLAAMMPRHRTRLLLTGFLTASALHAVWDTFGPMGVIAETLIGGLSFAFLVAATLKARQLSPSATNSVVGTRVPSQPNGYIKGEWEWKYQS